MRSTLEAGICVVTWQGSRRGTGAPPTRSPPAPSSPTRPRRVGHRRPSVNARDDHTCRRPR
jgi:hypothetical protein